MKRTLFLIALGLAVGGNAWADKPIRFKAHLEGFNLLGQMVDTNATGQARVEVIDDGTALAFRINVAGIENLLMAHIHVSSDPNTPLPVPVDGFPAGPVAYWFMGGPPPGTTLEERVNGRLAEGFIITDGDLQSWSDPDPNLDGTVAGLINAMMEGRASVIIHTSDGDPATNPFPDTPGVQGDAPGGELRGTLE